jgi:hypothetical protein
MSEARRRSRRLRGLQPDTQLGLCFICQDELQIEAVSRYVKTNCCGALLHRPCFISMTTRANFCGNCRLGFGTDAPEINLESDEVMEEEGAVEGINMAISGTTEYYLSFLRAEIDSYIGEERHANCHRINSSSWTVLPLAINPDIWLVYYMELLYFADRFPNQSMYIHAQIDLPILTTPIIRFVIYSLFIYNTPYAMFHLIDGISFRILFNFNTHINHITCNLLELLPSSGGPPLYDDDDINYMINNVLNR